MRSILPLAAVLAALCASMSLRAEPRERIVHAIDVQAPFTPRIVPVAGRPHLVYELHITNFRPQDVALKRIAIRDPRRAEPLAELAGNTLARALGRPGLSRDVADGRLVAGGMRAVLYVWLPLGDERPGEIAHRFDLEVTRAAGMEQETVEAGVLRVADATPLRLRAPLRGGPWAALYAPEMAHGHRTSIYAVDGRARIPGRFAIDWVKLDHQASRARGNGERVDDWLGYGAEVLAVADAMVVAARDDMVEDISTSGPSTRPGKLEQASGNYVILDLGERRFAFYEHLKHGSVRVRAGERVRAGDVIAQLGNSGSSSSGPHLHFHVADAPSALGAEGIPYVFERFEMIGAFESIDKAASGAPWRSVADGRERSGELPGPNTVVMF